ncbi:MAG: TusE/DsrC/DsvC family sulfur relay protein [Gammaproteobacteria bacterium]|nr:TusE/DsrC/DsvC family sulfur relay protein [Gammaproteobacteria bacterium]
MNKINVERCDSGFLVDPEDWDETLAVTLAEEESIDLQAAHWRIIHLVRELYFQGGVVPELRHIMKRLKAELGADQATRKYVYHLFPYGYGQQACKIAGMRIPRKLWLDV